MWKRAKTTDRYAKGQGYSLVHRYIQHFNEVSGNKPAPSRKRSKIPGVMITQHVADIPADKSTPDFQRKPLSVNIQEVGFNKQKAMEELDSATTDPSEFRKMLRKSKVPEKQEKKEDEAIDERFWEIILNADRKDYESICAEYGVKDLRLILKKLKEKEQESEEEQCKDGVMIPYDEDTNQKHSLKTAGSKLGFNIKDPMPEDADQVDVEEVTTEFRIPKVDFVVRIQEMKVEEREDALFECVLTHPLPSIKWMGRNSTLQDGEKYSITVSDDKLIHRLLVKDCKLLDKGIYSAVAGIKCCSAWLVLKADSDPAPTGKKKARKTTSAGEAGIDLEKLAKEQHIKIQEEKKIETAVRAKKEAKQLIDTKLPTTDSGDGKITAVTKLGKNSGAGQDKTQATNARALSEKVGIEEEATINSSRTDGNGSQLNSSGCITKEEVDLIIDDSKSKYTRHTKTGQVDSVIGSQRQLLRQSPLNDDVDAHTQAGESTNLDNPDGTEDISGSAKHARYTSHGSQDKVTGEQTDPNDPDGTEDSEFAKHIRHTNQRSQLHDTKIDSNEGRSTDAYEDSIGSAKHSRDTKQDHQTHSGVIDSNEGRYTDGNENSNGSAKHSRDTKQDHQAHSGVIDPNALCDFDGDEECTRSAKRSARTKQGQGIQDPNEPSDCDGSESSTGLVKRSSVLSSSMNQGQQPQGVATGESTDPNAQSEYDETEDATGSATPSRRERQGPLIQDLVIDPGVQFIIGLSDVNATIGEPAEITCKLSSEDCEGGWFRDGKKLLADDNFIITQDGASHKLVISSCQEEHSGKYRFEADGRKTEAMINVKDLPRFDPDDLNAFTKPVTVKVGQNAIFNLPFVGLKPMKIQWYREGNELLDDYNVKIEKCVSHSRLLLSKCQRKDTGEIKIKLKNEHGTTEAISQLIVLDKPTPPLGPTEIIESSATCIEFKWRPPKDDGGSPVISYILERQQVGRNTWKKIGEIPGVPCYLDRNVEHGRRYCYRIRAMTAEGISEMMETDDIQAGTLAFPGPPAPPKVISTSDDCITLSWAPPTNTGGSRILGYILEKRKKGSNLWSVVNPMDELIKEKNYAVKDIVAGMEYEFRVTAINISGAGEFSNPSEFVFARDPKKPPGKVIDLKVTETSYTHLTLAWTKPEDKPGVQDEAKGYYVEVRLAECTEWSRCNAAPIILNSFTVKGLKSMGMYWVRVIATNEGGDSAPQDLANYVLAMPSPVRPRFIGRKMKSLMVIRAGNAVRITVDFEASPRPEIMWLKDNVPVSKRVTMSNSDESSQLLIPSSERSDSGVYSILVKNMAGQETFSIEVRVTDDPKPPGPVELEENVPGTVTVIWVPSPDEKRDDHLHYTVSKLDSTKRTWTTVADRLFNHKFTVCNIMHGREYHFRVYAKNDMGISEPSESPTWGMERKKEKFVVSIPAKKDCDLRCAPTFIVPLKLHTAPKGYECYMSCAVKGNPKPRITWYRNNISLNTNTNYYISNTCGVCSMLILRVGPNDMGEYGITAENALGRAECSTILSVRE